MKKLIVLFVAVELLLYAPFVALGASNFPWPMFVPATTGTGLCGTDYIYHCRNRTDCLQYDGQWYNNLCHQAVIITEINNVSECSAFGGHWYSNRCHQSVVIENINNERECSNYYGYWYNYGCHQDLVLTAIDLAHECDQYDGYWYDYSCNVTCSGFLESCEDQVSCEKFDGYWYGDECNNTKSYNQEQMEELAGSWAFYYIVNSVTFVESYDFDINTVREYPVGSGEFTITGVDSYGNSVDTYERLNGLGAPRIVFVNYGFPTLDEEFSFYIKSNGIEAKGYFRMTDKGDSFPVYSTSYDMWGIRK